MNQQPDKLFRDKLHNHQKPVSPEAWKRISQQVSHPGTKNLWLKTAAAILLLAVAGVLVLSLDFENHDQVITQTGPVDKDKPVAPEKKVAEESAPVLKNETRESAAAVQHEVPPKAEKKKQPRKSSPKSLSTPATPEQTTLAEAPLVNDHEPVTQNVSDVMGIPVVASEAHSKSVTIVFNAEEVNKKYLTKKPEVEATSEEKESSTLKRMLDKAYDLTHNQDPMGNLRQKKNEILAMNFKNDKQRTETD